MREPLHRHRAARMATACAILLGLAVPAAADPPPGGQPGQPPPGGQPSAPQQPPEPPKPPKYPTSTAIEKDWGPAPPASADAASPPPAEAPSPIPGGFNLKTQCIQSNVKLPLTRKPWPQDQLGIKKAHQFATGAGNTVAVIDTGVSHHDYLGQRLLSGGDYVKPEDGGTKDCDGHGTEVAGIIAANSHNEVGFNGMAPDSNILSIRTNSNLYESKAKDENDQSHQPGTIESLAKAVMWSLKQSKQLNTNLAAINISLTSCISNPGALDQGYKELKAAIDQATKQDVVVVAAAGNKAKDQSKGCTQNNDDPDPNKIKSIPIPPWLGENVLSVGSVNNEGSPSDFSIGGPWLGVAAPGEDLISLDPGSPDKLVNQSVEVDPNPGSSEGGGGGQQQPQKLKGTSFAAPYVSGLVSLLRQKFPKGQYSAQDIIRRIKMTAQHPGGKDGRNNQVGYGMINPVAALTADIPAEDGARPDQSVSIPAALPPPNDDSNTPMTVALAGGGGALFLLIMTAFVMYTVKRARQQRGS